MVLTATALALVLAVPAQPELETVAERSGWQATATHDEVMTLIGRLASRSSIMHVEALGRTVEGRSIPLVVLANPPIASAEAARESGKVVVFAFGGIHGGEVCGKEALLMLARELGQQPDHPLWNDVILAFAPVLNADGNDRMNPDNRPGQVGPIQGMGERANAQGLDLNRGGPAPKPPPPAATPSPTTSSASATRSPPPTSR